MKIHYRKLTPFGVFAGLITASAFVQCAPSALADESWLNIVHHTSDTDQVMPYVRAGLAGVPGKIKDDLWGAGYKVIVTPTMLYGEASDTLERRSSYDVGSSNNIAGQFRSADHTLYIPERCSWGNDVPRLQARNDLSGVIRHEFGHAYDCYMHYPSQAANFSQAYATDSAKLTNDQRRTFSYFSMQQPGTSATELFAELFNIITCTDDRTLRNYDRALYESFPDCVQCILALNPDLKAHQFSGAAPAVPVAAETTSGASGKSPAPSAPPVAATPLQTAARLIAGRQYSQAIPFLDAIISKEPNNGLAFNYRAYAHLATANYKQAVSDYTQVLRLNPQDSNAAKNLKLAKEYSAK